MNPTQQPLSQPTREYLEWSWNHGIAEMLLEETTGGIARAISVGISRGEDQSDADLIRDWIEQRVNLETEETEWTPDHLSILQEIRTHDEYASLLEAVREENI